MWACWVPTGRLPSSWVRSDRIFHIGGASSCFASWWLVRHPQLLPQDLSPVCMTGWKLLRCAVGGCGSRLLLWVPESGWPACGNGHSCRWDHIQAYWVPPVSWWCRVSSSCWTARQSLRLCRYMSFCCRNSVCFWRDRHWRLISVYSGRSCQVHTRWTCRPGRAIRPKNGSEVIRMLWRLPDCGSAENCDQTSCWSSQCRRCRSSRCRWAMLWPMDRVSPQEPFRRSSEPIRHWYMQDSALSRGHSCCCSWQCVWVYWRRSYRCTRLWLWSRCPDVWWSISRLRLPVRRK